MTKELDAAPGDIRALKHRIHELEGEVIGYKRILDAQAAQAQAAEPDPCPDTCALGEGYCLQHCAKKLIAEAAVEPVTANVTRLSETIGRINLDRERMREAMRMALEALKFIKQWGECALAVEKRDAAIAALEKELAP